MAMRSPLEIVPFWLLEVKMLGPGEHGEVGFRLERLQVDAEIADGAVGAEAAAEATRIDDRR